MNIRTVIRNTSIVVVCMFSVVVEAAEVLMGDIEDSPRWGSGALVLDPPRNFSQGEKLELIIGGSAEKIKVRLLPKNKKPDTSAGVLPNFYEVPKDNRTVLIELKEDRLNIVQVSVHGGPKPWGKYSLGGNNGPATIEQVVVIGKP